MTQADGHDDLRSEFGTSWASSAGVRRSMKSNRRVDTKPELRVRSALHARGFRFRKDYRIDLPAHRVRVDVAFPRRRVAVFVDGCFWHRCPEHGSDPVRNSTFWEAKLSRNVERDRAADQALTDAGWRVVRVWEHDATEVATDKIVAALSATGSEGDAGCS